MRKIAGIVLVVLMFNLLSVNVQAQPTSNNAAIVQNIENSVLGLQSIESQEIDGKDYRVTINVDSEKGKEISELKLFANIAAGKGGGGHFEFDILDSFELSLKKIDDSKFQADLLQEQISSMDSIWVNKIEITYNDGSKKVSSNSYFNKTAEENGEVISVWNFIENPQPISIVSSSVDKNKVFLGDKVNYTINLKNLSKRIDISKVYVKLLDSNYQDNETQVFTASKVNDTTYNASISFSNTAQAGRWNIMNISILDSANRSYDLYVAESISIDVVAGDVDIKAPVLKDITVSSNIYDPVNTIYPKFEFDIDEDITSGSITFRDKNNAKNKVYASIRTEDGKVIANAMFSCNGTYDIESIYLADNSNNTITYYNPNYLNASDIYTNEKEEKDFSSYTIEAINTGNEYEEFAINIDSIVNHNKNITNGNEINLELNLSGNKNIYAVAISIQEKEGAASKYFFLGNLNSDEQGKLTVNVKPNEDDLKYLASGKYQINNVTVYYEGGFAGTVTFTNSSFEFMGDDDIPYDFSDAEFVCNNPNEDIKGPEFSDVTLDKNIVLPGDKINFSFKVKDDKSGINDSEWPNLNYSNGSGFAELDVKYTNYDKSTGLYEGVITIPNNISAGSYEPTISIRDNAGNYGYLSPYNSSKEEYKKAVIVIKNDLNEPLPPVIDSNIGTSINEKFTLPFKPSIDSDHGNVEMELNGKPYTGEELNAIGNYSLYVKAIGLDGSVSTKLLKFKVIGQMGNSTKPVDVVKDINNSVGNEIEFLVNSDSKEVDSTIFTAIKNTGKTAELTQMDGTSWMFDSKDISLDKVTTINLKVSNSAGKEVDNKIDEIDNSAKIINFDYEGELPGKATVKTRVSKTRSTKEDLTLYSYDSKTGEIKKIQDKATIDDTGFVEMTVSEGTTYFLSSKATLAGDDTTSGGTTDKDDTEDSDEDKDNDTNKGDTSGSGQDSSDNKENAVTDKNNADNNNKVNGKQPQTGDNSAILPLVILLLSSGIILTRKLRKARN